MVKENLEEIRAAAEAETEAAEAQSDSVISTATAAQGAVAAAEAGAALATAQAAKAELEASEDIEEVEEKWAHLGSQMELLHQRTQSLETGLTTLSTQLPEMIATLETNLKNSLIPPKQSEAIDPQKASLSENPAGLPNSNQQPKVENQKEKQNRIIRRL